MTEFESPAHRRSLLMFVSMLRTEHRLGAAAGSLCYLVFRTVGRSLGAEYWKLSGLLPPKGCPEGAGKLSPGFTRWVYPG
jgi:hypothetical protein